MAHKPEIAIVGRACRLPGAPSVARLWTLLAEQRCAITRIPEDRWSLKRFGHPRQSERGRSYTWAAGVLDDIWGFDAAAFGVSPREAEQMDPQQRLLLELTWEALEDAGIVPSSLAGTETGVFVGASTTDHGNSKMFDVAATDGYFATGNAASILSNRISYIYDLNGPSFTVDTACSSSMVALDAAVQALRSERIDTAIVGGVSILTTPFQFINFSQASMLSRKGLCQAFSAGADGYVRAEGGGVLVLRSLAAAERDGDRVHARILATRVNSDGRTNGIALPSKKRQAQLLEQLYRTEQIDPADLAFVEAHGTGTPVGDPIEATALGEVLGQQRTAPLPIGSIKSNIGHTEAAAGIAGILKATLALDHDLLPASLHCAELNPAIAFDRLNLAVARHAVALPRGSAPRLAGVSSYGFGGTNAHVVIADADAAPARPAAAPASVLVITAHTKAALGQLASAYADRLQQDPAAAGTIAGATHRHRDQLEERLVVGLDAPETAIAQLRAYADDGADSVGLVTASVGGDAPRVAFVYSGNGSQWAGMGRAAYAANPTFRARFDEVDRLFEALSGWSLHAMMQGDTLATDLSRTSVAQPLIFAIQAASTAALRALGLQPDMVLGHSVGEVGAAEAAGVFDLATAVKIIYFRSHHQEAVFQAGGMTVLIGSLDAARSIEATIPGATIAAFNSPRAFTFSGPTAAIEAIGKAAKSLKARAQKLDIAYPFHSPLIAAIEQPLLISLGVLPAQDATTPFLSTVTGDTLAGSALDAGYWWRNIREPVLFSDAVAAAVKRGARVFVEVGPSAILLSNVSDVLAAHDVKGATMTVLDRKDTPGEPFRRTVIGALARGVAIAGPALLGGDPGPEVPLPSYPWQRKTSRLPESIEALAFLTPAPHHPLIGARYALDELEWHGQIDTALMPALADHVVDGHILLPGAAFAEMVLAVARDWLKTTTASVADFEIQQPLILAANGSRDIRARIQPVTGTVEIMSRPRLGQAAWQTHAVAKILRHTIDAEPLPAWSGDSGGTPVTGDTIYPLAAESGLAYGPAFRLLDNARRIGPRAIRVDLLSGPQDVDLALDPARVDACFHGLALLYQELSVNGRLKPYVPVGAGEIRLYVPGARVDHAFVEILRSDERTIIVDFTLTDAAGEIVAQFRRLRFQAMNAFRAAEKPIEHVGAFSLLASEPLALPDAPALGAADILAAAQAIGAVADNDAPTPAYVLMDGWATATAYGLLESLSDDGRLDVSTLLASGRLPDHLGAWCRRLLVATERSGLLTQNPDGSAALRSGLELPDPNDILQALAADHPERSAELLLAARTGAIVDAILSGHYDRSRPVTTTALDGFDLGGHAATASATLLASVVAQTVGSWPADRMMRILQLGDGPLTAQAVRLATGDHATLTLVEPDRRRLEHARLGFGRGHEMSFVANLSDLPPGGFDLVIASQTAHRVLGDDGLGALSTAMAPGAVLAILAPTASVFHDLVFGLQAAMVAPAGEDPRRDALASDVGWTQSLERTGLIEVAVRATRGTDFALLCVGEKSAVRPIRVPKGDVLIVGRGGLQPTAESLATMLTFAGFTVSSAIGIAAPLGLDDAMPEAIVYLAQATAGTAAGRLIERCLDLKAMAGAIGTRKTVLWVVCPGATRASSDETAVEAGVWAFCRALANETATLEIKLVDLAPHLDTDVASRRLRDVIVSGTDENEIVVHGSGTHVRRFDRLVLESHMAIEAGDTALRLVKGDAATGLDRLQWTRETRAAPGAGEVEIAVAAAGLNFRDVMWGLSILPEEILEDGFAGATLGLECAGAVARVGPGVEGFNPGDRVLAFAKAALATHVTVPVSVVAHLPPNLEPAAAATIPVAFLTAYYALIRCARLDEDEWVLIHGGAGGVGLAAMQIARWRGARIIATAGSPERRDLLTMLGAEHVFDSRSNQFVDDVRRVTGSGVDVVLNSLSGEAMERSITVLRPFGRFVELGKRDYVANTHIGLKPFRKNLSYFGVDLDQLMLKDDNAGRTLFSDVMALFKDGALTALPYRTFAAAETVEAFRVMQRSGHVGKIVIAPPPLQSARASTARPLRLNGPGAHLITGGLGGFGLETARWLVDHGARDLVLVGRSGAAAPDAQAAVEALRQAGATVTVVALDILDEAAVTALFGRFGDTLPPLVGVVHAATVFDDAIVANMSPERLARVVGAKVGGAALLDRLTRDLSLDYFLLYSSATTIIGNPGQGAYVAANAYLEGLALMRRAAGLPALAVAWGAIEDVGVLTRSSAAATNLLQRAGVLGMVAREALDDLLRVSGDLPADTAVLVLASVNWATAREHLPVLRSRSFERLMQGVQASEGSTKAKINVKALVEERGVTEAGKAIGETVLDEIARILRLPREDVSRTKPLMEIGLDSLMAVELGMGLEERFELDAPLSTSAGAMSIVELADYIAAAASGDGASDQTSVDVALRHLDPAIRRDVIEALPEVGGERVDPKLESLS